MKFNQILRLILYLVIIAYLVLMHFQNPSPISLPFFISLPPAIVAAVAFVLGILVELLSGRLALWSKSREIRKLKKELEKSGSDFSGFAGSNIKKTVIPDRQEEVHLEDSDENS